MGKILTKSKTTKVVKNKSGSRTTYSKVGKSWKATGFSNGRNK
jgi:hypothetical protein